MPAEIRNKIWEFTLYGGSIDLNIKSPLVPLPSITKTCRQTLVETLGIFFHHTEVSFSILGLNGAWTATRFWDDVRALERLVAKLSGHDEVEEFDLIPSYDLLGSPTWPNCIAWAKVAYESGNVCTLDADTFLGNWKVFAHMMNTVSDLWVRYVSWEHVELVLESMRQIAAVRDPAWSRD